MLSSVVSAGGRATAALVAVAGALLVGACSSELPPRSTLHLMQDAAVLQGVLLRCNQLQGAALRDAECRNAREAVERLAAEEDARKAADDEEFERAREARRARDEQERRLNEATEEVDPYTMPLVPEQPATPAPAAAAVSPLVPEQPTPPAPAAAAVSPLAPEQPTPPAPATAAMSDASAPTG